MFRKILGYQFEKFSVTKSLLPIYLDSTIFCAWQENNAFPISKLKLLK